MSRRRFFIPSNSKTPDLNQGLVFYASFKNYLTAESGQELDGNWEIVFDNDLNRNVAEAIDGSSVKFPISGLPKGNESFSIGGWFKSSGNILTLLAWGNAPSTPNTAAHLSYANPNGRTVISFPTGYADVDYAINTPANLNQWYYCCGGHDQETGYNVFYVNGNKIGESHKTLNVGTSSAAIGCFWSNQGGIVSAAEVKIYNRMLSEFEFQKLFEEAK